MSKATKEKIEEDKAELRRLLPKGSKLYVIIRSVSSSGMSRVMTPIVLQIRSVLGETSDGRIGGDIDSLNPGARISRVLGVQYVDDGNHSLRVKGVGMNMAFWLADALSNALYNEPGAITHDVL